MSTTFSCMLDHLRLDIIPQVMCVLQELQQALAALEESQAAIARASEDRQEVWTNFVAASCGHQPSLVLAYVCHQISIGSSVVTSACIAADA